MSKRLFILLGIIQIFVAINAIPAGLLLIITPDGTALGMTDEALRNTPFESYLIPGVFLFIVNGLLNIYAAVFSFKRKTIAGKIGIILGVVLILWILFQVYFIGLISFLQPLFFVIGIFEIIISYNISKETDMRSNTTSQ